MNKQKTLKPGDIVVALQLALTPETALSNLADATKRSIGEVHNAIGRLRTSGLVDPEARRIEREPLVQFIRWGVPYAFPPTTGGTTVGIATAVILNSPEVGEPVHSEFVWPASGGTSRGESLVPLHPRVPELADQNPRLRALLAVVDLIRIGGTRERTAAVAELERVLAAAVS